MPELGNGTTFSAGGTTIGTVLSLSGPNPSVPTIDISGTGNNTVFNDLDKGAGSGGQFQVTIAYSTDGLTTMGALLGSRDTSAFVVTFGTTVLSAETFSGYVVGLGKTVERNSLITGTATIEVSGDPGY